MTPLTLVLTLAFVALIALAAFGAWRAQRQLATMYADLLSLMIHPDDPARRDRLLRDTRLQAVSRGLEGMPLLDRSHFAAQFRGRVMEQRGQLATMIELMPMLGLLGTIAGLILAVARGQGGRMDGVWTALVTTAVGLGTAAVCKWVLELRGDRDANHTLELLAKDQLVASLISLEGGPSQPAPAGETD